MRFIPLIFCLFSAPVLAADNAEIMSPKKIDRLNVTVEGFESGGPIPEKFAFCSRNGADGFGKAGNKSPIIRWSGAPRNTLSYAIIMLDPDVPASFELANQEGKIIPESFPRQNFYHWVLLNISSNRLNLMEGADGNGVQLHGKTPGITELGLRGVNDYTAAFKGNPKLDGAYGGYDGPCPPWNDARLHHYHFKVFALNIRNLTVDGQVTGLEAVKAMTPHILAMGEVIGTYSTNRAVLE